MNRIWGFSILSLAIVLASCARDVEGENVPVAEMPGISVYAEAPQPESGAEDEQKAELNDGGDFYYTTWSATDRAMLVENSAAGMLCSPSTSVVLSDNSKKARFEFEPLTPVVAESFDYAVFHPMFSEGSGDNKKDFPYADGLKLNLKLLPGQTPEATTPDPKTCMILGLSNGHKVRPDRLDVQFSHIVSYGRMALSGLKEGETITSVNLSFQGCNVAGEMSWTSGGGVKYDEGNRNWIFLTCNKVAVNKGKADIWFACKPCTLAAGKTLTITTKTSLNPDGYEIRLTARNNVVFAAGKVTEFPAYVSKDIKVTPDPGYTVTGKIIYAASNGSNEKDGSTKADATSVSHAVELSRPGDQVRLLPGTYDEKLWCKLELKAGKSGTPGNYISYVADDPSNRPEIYIHDKAWHGIKIDASYIAIDGICVRGDNPNISGEGSDPQHNANGITIGASNLTSAFPHHVIVRNCRVSDVPGGGISAMHADYVTVENNEIYNCAWYTCYACSGISFLESENTDNNHDTNLYKMIVRGNKVFGCKTLNDWTQVGHRSDGNGIIIDSNAPDYDGRFLVANNVTVHNGGSGIHAFKSAHVDIVGNSSYQNGYMYDDNSYGEIYAHGNYSEDVRIYNNIMYGRSGAKCNMGNGATYTNNVYYLGSVQISGTGDLIADPLYVNPTTDPATADFHLKAGSPAIGHGTATSLPLPQYDHDFYIRKGGFDCGAYQYIAK